MALLNSKSTPWIVALAFAVVAGLMSYKACNQLPSKLRDAELKYQAYRAMSIADQKKPDAVIAGLRADNAKVAEENTGLKKDVGTLKATVAAQVQTIADLQANEPPTTPEIEAMPIVINLRAQVKSLTVAFSLAQTTIEKQDKIILNLELTVRNMEGIITEWQTKFNRADALRLAAESLNLGYKKQIASMRLTGTIEKVVIGGLAAGVVYGFVRK